MNWHEYFDYCPTTGALRWKQERPVSHFKNTRGAKLWHSRYAGTIVACKDTYGYIQAGLSGRRHLAHRIIWEMMNGAIPKGCEIDHVNGVRDDNRIENMRIATHEQNMRNTRLRSDNKTGYKGVRLRDGIWVASIKKAGKHIHVGHFETAEDAHRAYCVAAAMLHGEYARTA